MGRKLRVLHTSDWHLGRCLIDQNRHTEFEAFIGWLSRTIKEKQVDLLLIAGDVFDVVRPHHAAQELYYRFLGQISHESGVQIVVTAGNHDSATLIDAPAEVLKPNSTYVIGSVDRNNLEREVITIKDKNGEPLAIVAAVPFLHDGDVRYMVEGESISEADSRLQAGIAEHYRQIAELAQARRQELGADIPIIAMGHLFTQNGKLSEDAGERNLYVGTAVEVAADMFSPDFDYVALGHLHMAQKVGGHDHIRYSGAPLPMSFSEAGQKKCVYIIDFDGRKPTVETLEIETFQKLERLKGDLQDLTDAVRARVEAHEDVWLMVTYTGSDLVAHLEDDLLEIIKRDPNSRVKILRTVVPPPPESMAAVSFDGKTLEEITPQEMFVKYLESVKLSEEEVAELSCTFAEALELLERDEIERANGLAQLEDSAV